MHHLDRMTSCKNGSPHKTYLACSFWIYAAVATVDKNQHNSKKENKDYSRIFRETLRILEYDANKQRKTNKTIYKNLRTSSRAENIWKRVTGITSKKHGYFQLVESTPDRSGT